ncbi:MAG: InlB B-repeat-containing protein [Planctomycetota bacterium]
MSEDPNFTEGYYLCHIAAGQDVDSVCIDAGSAEVTDPNVDLDPDEYTTRTDGIGDFGIVDMGYHYLIASMPWLSVDVVDANGTVVDPVIGHGYVEPSGGRRYPEGTIIELTAYPDEGYRVKRWTDTDDDASTDPNNTVTMNRDRHVTVEFELTPIRQLETVVVGGNGELRPRHPEPLDFDPVGRTYSYYEDTVVTLQADPCEGYRVGRWIGTDDDWSADRTNTVTMTEDKVVIVMFELPRIVEVSGDANAIHYAVDAARSGDTLIVAAGTYNGDIDLLGKGITLTGTNPDDPNVVLATVIDCQQTRRGFIFDSGEDANTVVDGFSIVNGAGIGGYGGGVYVGPGCSPTVKNLIISNCVADPNGGGYGGGIYVSTNAGPTFVNCTVADCNADRGAGAFCDIKSSPTFEHCTFNNNSAGLGSGLFCDRDVSLTVADCNFVNNLADYGGGMYLDPNCSGTVTGTVLISNDANQDGGGIFLNTSGNVAELLLSIVDCEVIDNSARRGAGLFTRRSSAIAVTGCTFRFNKAPAAAFEPNDPNDPSILIVGQGGAIYSFGTPALISDCVIADNFANTSGGGMYLTGGPNSPQVINCLIASNLAGRDGGGVSINWHVESLLANCTLVANAATGAFGQAGNTGFGGGLYCGYNGDSVVIDSILWNNYAIDGYQIAVARGFDYGPWPSTLTVSYSDVEGGRTDVKVEDYECTLIWGAGNIKVDPLFVAGPLGPFYLSQIAAGQSQNSPCVNAGSNDASYLGMTEYTTRTDEVFDKLVVDMGYHYPLSQTLEPCRLCDLVLDGFIDFTDYAILALHWLNENCSDANGWCEDADLTFDSFVDFDDLAFFSECWLVEDIKAPLPNPAEWEIEPHPESLTPPYSIGMTARTALDTWGLDVEYYFECVSDGDFNSPDWQSDPTYEVVDLALGTELCFRVKARDVRLGRPEDRWRQTDWSEVRCAVASGEVQPPDTNEPAPYPYIKGVHGIEPNVIRVESTTAYDVSGVEYYFECTSGGGHDSGWQDGTIYIDVDLVPDTTYCYRVKARDKSPNLNETPWSAEDCNSTLPHPDLTAPTPDPMEWDPYGDPNGQPRLVLVDINDPVYGWGVTMTASSDTADESGFEFYFECTTEDFWSSHQWIQFAGPPYTYTRLIGTKWDVWAKAFRVMARDRSPNQNETGWSPELYAPPP